MKKWGVVVCVLLAVALVVSMPFSAHALLYSKTFYDPEVNGDLVTELNNTAPGVTSDTFTGGANFSSGFNLKVVKIDVDTVTDNGTVVVTFTLPCQGGNGNPYNDAGECHALNLAANCEDSNPHIDCDGVVNALDDAPQTGDADTESYRFNMIVGLWVGIPTDAIRIEVQPAILPPSQNVFIRRGAGLILSPTTIDFATLGNPYQFSFTLKNVNALVPLTNSWGFFAFANSDIDGPGEDSFRGDVTVDLPGLVCERKVFNKSIVNFPNDVVKATVRVRNTGELDIADLVITSIMSDAAKMDIVAGSSTLPGGDPVEGPPGTWTFPAQFLAAGDFLEFSYDVAITGMLVTDTLCNQIRAASEEFDIDVDGTQCRACVTTQDIPRVPALGTIGFSAALALITMGGVFLYRQRRRRA